MSPLLEQFIMEARDALQGIGEKLMALERAPDNADLMTDLFRRVHTLKGNSGLFEFPEMTRVLHASEDLMDAVRDNRVSYSLEMADRLLEAMDFVGRLIDEIESTGAIDTGHATPSNEMTQSLRMLIPEAKASEGGGDAIADATTPERSPVPPLSDLPENVRMTAWQAGDPDELLYRVIYRPEEDCFFKGEDPFLQARNIPGLIWGVARERATWAPLAELDCYRCQIDFDALVDAPSKELEYYFRYVPEQVEIQPVRKLALVTPRGRLNGRVAHDGFVTEALNLLQEGDLEGVRAAVRAILQISDPALWLSSALRWLLALLDTAPERPAVLRRLIESLRTMTPPDWCDLQGAAETSVNPSAQAPVQSVPSLSEEDRGWLNAILSSQSAILELSDSVNWLAGRLQACAAALSACLSYLGESPEEIEEALAKSIVNQSSRPLRDWLNAFRDGLSPAQPSSEKPGMSLPPAASSSSPAQPIPPRPSPGAVRRPHAADPPAPNSTERRAPGTSSPAPDAESKFGRRAEDALGSKVLKVDQAKVDRLMNLIGEMVVAKNSLPYLSNRAENHYGLQELAREIKAQYAVINRIAEEMQGAIMQVRMMPVSFVFQRFPRLVRDISRKLGKDVELELEGEETEADKNIVESIADPLIHIIRNSLDHGLETPEGRAAAGKPRVGRLVIRACQESDRVLIDVADDGRGIDPVVVKGKAYKNGLIGEDRLDRMSDQEAINLVFAPGFSTAENVSDLSGRGVGMDVVRNAIDKVGGTVQLSSEVGKGTRLRLSLPLSMAVTNVIIIESNRQIFGVPMDMVVETVRLPRARIRTIKNQKTAVLRGRIVPLMALNELLSIPAEPQASSDDELATLVVRVGDEQVGLLVDNFRVVVDVILKPMPGDLAKLTCYGGTALLGDGSVLMVLNPKELLLWASHSR
jgi:two-component system chemotaxis sensor kinase CheA